MFPSNADRILEEAVAFRSRLKEVKSSRSVPDYGWYPYESLAALPEIVELMGDEFENISQALQTEPALDLGCGDGDLAVLLDHLGVRTDAVDHAETNFNQMRGVHVLNQAVHGSVQIVDLDLDKYFTLPREQYGVAFFLGTLYHLKNPFYVLEELATRAAYCVMSTRVARVTRSGGPLIEAAPVAYLLSPREANNDPTNFWVFSPAGLARLVDRAGWLIRGELYRGCRQDSNPVEPTADERSFLLLKSRNRFTDLHARPLYGWHGAEENSWRWTMKEFGIEVVLPKDRPAREFALRLTVTDSVIEAGPVLVTCKAAGKEAGSLTCDHAGAVEFRGRFSDSATVASTNILDFQVESRFQPANDRRELGVLVPLLNSMHSATARLPFRIS